MMLIRQQLGSCVKRK